MDRRPLILALGTFAVGTDSLVVAGLLPEVARSFDVSIAAAGQLITVYAITYAILTPVMAALTAHWPRKRVLLSGLTIFVCGNILTATLPTFDLVLASRAVAALGGAMFSPAASATAAALVAPERRGRALAVVVAGLSGATALGAPIGTFVGSLGDWRITMWFVATLGALAALGVLAVLPRIAAPQPLSLRERLAPLGDRRVVATLGTSFLVLAGLYIVYAYISVVFDRATGGDGTILAPLLSLWGVAATVGNLGAGSLTDRFGNRRVLNVAIAIVALDFALMPWTTATLPGAAVALVVWGLCGWGALVPQQHRLIGIAPPLAPILLALNTAAIYVAISVSSAVGALAMKTIDPHHLPGLSAVLILSGLAAAELAHRLLKRSRDVGTPAARITTPSA